MSATIPTTEPTAIRQGDGVSWLRRLEGFPASAGWVLHYRIVFRTPPAVTFDAVADGDDHRVDLTATQTATWQAGGGTLVAWVTNAAQRTTLTQQPIDVLVDLTAAASADDRSANRQALEAAEAARRAYVTGGQMHVAEYDIAGRRMKFRSVAELDDLIAAYRREVARENAAAALAQGVSPGRIYTRF
jgi:hypothetical protein